MAEFSPIHNRMEGAAYNVHGTGHIEWKAAKAAATRDTNVNGSNLFIYLFSTCEAIGEFISDILKIIWREINHFKWGRNVYC